MVVGLIPVVTRDGVVRGVYAVEAVTIGICVVVVSGRWANPVVTGWYDVVGMLLMVEGAMGRTGWAVRDVPTAGIFAPCGRFASMQVCEERTPPCCISAVAF